eukprot:2552535-Prymnesium_polylepis.2
MRPPLARINAPDMVSNRGSPPHRSIKLQAFVYSVSSSMDSSTSAESSSNAIASPGASKSTLTSSAEASKPLSRVVIKTFEDVPSSMHVSKGSSD